MLAVALNRSLIMALAFLARLLTQEFTTLILIKQSEMRKNPKGYKMKSIKQAKEVLRIMVLAYQYNLDPIPINGYVLINDNGKELIIKRHRHLVKHLTYGRE